MQMGALTDLQTCTEQLIQTFHGHRHALVPMLEEYATVLLNKNTARSATCANKLDN